MLLGGLGNFLTLLAIPYVRLKYGMKFSVLQINSVELILHLSFADLLYSLIGFPNFLMVTWLVANNITNVYMSILGLLL